MEEQGITACNTVKHVDRDRVMDAFLDLMDGVVLSSELERFTGLSEDRCHEIYDIFVDVLTERGIV